MTRSKAAKPPLSLKARVAFAVGAVMVTALVLVVIAALEYGRSAARENYDRLLAAAARDMADAIFIVDGGILVNLPMSAFQILAIAENDRVDYRIIGPTGETVTGHPTTPVGPGQAELEYFDHEFGGEPARYVALRREFLEEGLKGPITVVVGQTMRARQAMGKQFAQNAFATLAAIGLAVAVFAWIAVGSALRPLGRIGRLLRDRAATDLAPFTVQAPSEIGQTLDALNGFMARLKRQLDANEHLIGDAAHQLRTPLAAIRAQADLAAAEPDLERKALAIARIQDRALLISRLVDQLLNRAMLTHRQDSVPRVPLDLRDVAVEVMEQSDHDVLATGTKVSLQLPDAPVWVHGDELSLTEAGKNLLVNALKYGKSPVRVSVSSNNTAELCVSDAGTGPSDEVIAHAKHRYANSSDSGSGLGLSIASEVAESHGGRLTLRRRPTGFEIGLDLPLGKAP